MNVINGNIIHHFLWIPQNTRRYKLANIIPGMNRPDNAGIHHLSGLIHGAKIPHTPKNVIPRVAGFINR